MTLQSPSGSARTMSERLASTHSKKAHDGTEPCIASWLLLKLTMLWAAVLWCIVKDPHMLSRERCQLAVLKPLGSSASLHCPKSSQALRKEVHLSKPACLSGELLKPGMPFPNLGPAVYLTAASGMARETFTANCADIDSHQCLTEEMLLVCIGGTWPLGINRSSTVWQIHCQSQSFQHTSRPRSAHQFRPQDPDMQHEVRRCPSLISLYTCTGPDLHRVTAAACSSLTDCKILPDFGACFASTLVVLANLTMQESSMQSEAALPFSADMQARTSHSSLLLAA